MNKQELLKYLASAAFDIGFGAKKHFAAFDIIEKGPGWLGLVSLVGGIYGFFVPFMALAHVSAMFIVFGFIALYIGMYGSDKQRYEEAGKALTLTFHDLHVLYRTLQSLPNTADLWSHLAQVTAIRSDAVSKSLSRQMFLADWYAHYKFFWQDQVDWVAEKRPFGFFRDKVPLTAYPVAAVVVIVSVLTMRAPSTALTSAIATEPTTTASAPAIAAASNPVATSAPIPASITASASK